MMPIFLLTNFKKQQNHGFTLIEVMVVLAIIAAIFMTAMPRIFQSKTNIKNVARQFLVLGKEIRNHARLQNSSMRLVIDLDPEKPSYWVEKANGFVLLADQKLPPQELKKDADGKPIDPQGWSMYQKLTKEKQPLPSGIYFASVETANMQSPVTEGTAYIHFFPEGLMEATALQLTNRTDVTWTLIYNPLTGQASVVETAKSLKEASQ